MPEVVIQILQVAGGLLPALGFAILLRQIISEGWMIFFFLFGWVLMGTNIFTVTGLVFVSAAIALVYVMARYQNPNNVSQQTNYDINKVGVHLWFDVF